MQPTRFERAAAPFAGLSLAVMIAAFAFGHARAQPVTPPISQPPPVFNPSSPNTVPQAPYVPVAPSSPGGGLSGSAPAPVSPDVVRPVPSPSLSPQTENAPKAARPARLHGHVRHPSRVHARGRHHRRVYVERVAGPSYYPGLGLVYPPYVNPCHLRPYWDGYYGDYLTYTCSY